jgi:hypothetical protein
MVPGVVAIFLVLAPPCFQNRGSLAAYLVQFGYSVSDLKGWEESSNEHVDPRRPSVDA